MFVVWGGPDVVWPSSSGHLPQVDVLKQDLVAFFAHQRVGAVLSAHWSGNTTKGFDLSLVISSLFGGVSWWTV